jgi:hypothetical protein
MMKDNAAKACLRQITLPQEKNAKYCMQWHVYYAMQLDHFLTVVSTISCSVIIWFMCNDSISNNFFYNKTLKIYHSIIYTINIINSIALLVRMHIYFTMQWNSFLSISLWLTQMASPFPHSFQGTPSPFHKACWSVRHGWCSSWEKNSSLCSKGHLPGDGQHWPVHP